MIPTKENFKETPGYKEFMYFMKSIEKRDGVSNVIKFLEENDFFYAPASSKAQYHGAYWGGLVEHSIDVIKGLIRLKRQYNIEQVTEESCILVGAFHDVCKVNRFLFTEELATDPQIYKMKNYFNPDQMEKLYGHGLTKSWASVLIDWAIKGKKGDLPDKTLVWEIQDDYPLGHGEKSVCMLLDMMALSKEEILAIRWHMGTYDTQSNTYEYKQARREYPLVPMIVVADLESTIIKDLFDNK